MQNLSDSNLRVDIIKELIIIANKSVIAKIFIPFIKLLMIIIGSKKIIALNK